ncbi:bZIP transcription factor 60-like isoform X2 [Phragmites australis]|uniref:bZIP transcription factor 60-like isoform X2 n=2 Tax=Phragmites australis TaxID=29695 RepID=UPI002D76AB3C|nr:bZIP transcription factor 60-like isoform X2 [Phragmites australis]
MAEPSLFAPVAQDAFADLPFPEFQTPVDDNFAFEVFDLEDLDLDVNFDLDLFASDGQLSQPPPLATSSSSAGSPERGSSSSGAGGVGGLRNEEASESSSRSASGKEKEGAEEEEEAKRRARLVRNRESAHLSRQRKKQYVEELEGKVKAMQATIADLSARISCVTAENAALKQQLGGAAGGSPPLPMYPAIYPLPMPWMHPAYAMRGSQVPLVPIPRLKKTQQPAPDAVEPPAKKARKTKKVASVSLLGLLCLVMVCGCLIPAVNRMYGAVDAGEGAAFGPSQHGRVLAVEGPRNSVSDVIDPMPPQSASETLPALLYLPRNGKHVKINGNLVIKSIVASEEASSRLSSFDGKSPGSQGKEETSLAIPGYVAPMEAGEVMESATGMKNRLLALAPGDGSKYREDDGLLPQWFSEAMSGPMLSSGMCTEVFQFDISSTSAHANGVVPVYSSAMSNSSRNFTENLPSGPQKVKNRRILYSEAIPLHGSTSNDTEHFKTPPKNESYGGRKPVSSVVVSVLADPREAGDGDSEGRSSSKSLSRIFVVVLLDSVKVASMYIRVKRNKSTYFIQCEPTETALNIKQKLHSLIDQPPSNQQLVLLATYDVLEDSKTLADQKVENDAIVALALRKDDNEFEEVFIARPEDFMSSS